MKAIETKYFGPGNVRGSRVRASDGDNAVYLAWDDGLSSDANHIAAAKALCSKLNWGGTWVTGHNKQGCVHVCTTPADAVESWTAQEVVK